MKMNLIKRLKMRNYLCFDGINHEAILTFFIAIFWDLRVELSLTRGVNTQGTLEVYDNSPNPTLCCLVPSLYESTKKYLNIYF